MVPSDLIVVSTFPSPAEAQIAKGVLDDAGIESLIRADNAGGMLPAIGGVDVVVRADDVQKANEALHRRHNRAHGAAGASPRGSA
jgi:Putative prokaryotic signal transducing protein